MYFFINFSHQGDEVAIRTGSRTVFDYRAHLAKTQEQSLQVILRRDPGIDKTSFLNSLQQYLDAYGYDKTANKLFKGAQTCPPDPETILKAYLRRTLMSNLTDKACKLLLKHKNLVPDIPKVMKYIRCLQLLHILKQVVPAKELVEFMAANLARYKGQKIEILDRQGQQIEVDIRVVSSDR